MWLPRVVAVSVLGAHAIHFLSEHDERVIAPRRRTRDRAWSRVYRFLKAFISVFVWIFLSDNIVRFLQTLVVSKGAVASVACVMFVIHTFVIPPVLHCLICMI